MSITIELHVKSGYPSRTVENAAKSDVTVAVASDFSTPGEVLTAKVARGRIIQIPHMASDVDTHVARLVAKLNEASEELGRDLVLNCAGNGVWQLPGRRQKDADEFAFNLLFETMASWKGRFNLSLVRSGGQSGYDVAFLKAADAMNIPALAHVARSADGKVLVRLADGKDSSLTIDEYREAMCL